MWYIRQLSTGWWHISCPTMCGWCQAPDWPMHPDKIGLYVHGSLQFIRAVAEENDKQYLELHSDEQSTGGTGQ